MNHFRARIEIHISSEKKNKYEYNGWEKRQKPTNFLNLRAIKILEIFSTESLFIITSSGNSISSFV